MARRSLFLISFLILFISVNALFSQSSELEGTWIVEKVIIDKNVRNNSTITTIYDNMNENIESFVLCPVKFIFNSGEMKFEYYDNSNETGTYSIIGDQLNILTPDAPLDYLITINEPNKVILTYEINYIVDGIQQVNEIYKFFIAKE